MMGRITGIFSCKGGVGKSFIAVNLGATLARYLDKSILVMDFSPVLGGLDLWLKVEAQHSWRDLIPVRNELTWKHIEIAVNKIENNYFFLSAPDSYPDEGFPTVELDVFEELLKGLSAHFHQVILDGFTLLGYPEIPFRSLDKVLYVTTPDISSVRSCTRYLRESSERSSREGVVINQWFPAALFSPGEVGELLGLPVFGVFPIDGRSVWENLHLGKLIISGTNRKFQKAFQNLAQAVEPTS